MFELGSIVRDKITGFEGIAVGYMRWHNGCNRYAIQSQTLHEGKPIEHQWFDDVQVELVKTLAEVHKPKGLRGGPLTNPRRSHSSPTW